MIVSHPYTDLPKSRFWKTGVVNQNPFCINSIYKKKWSIKKTDRICTAGSCFAQHITKRLKLFGFNIIDYEPPPHILDESEYITHGFSQYSCRYGNIYTVRQLLQLVMEAFGELKPHDYIWENSNRYYDALRPNIFPGGLSCREEVALLRNCHLSKVRKAFYDMDVFIFTMGLTETWFNLKSETVYPTCPGIIAGNYDPNLYSFINYDYISILNDFKLLLSTLKKYRKRGVRTILTVSPVPLTATATSSHVLQAVTYSKSVLRAVAGYLSSQLNSIDYFPSYEIVNNPILHSVAFESNGRTIKPQIVDIVMKHLFQEHVPYENTNILPTLELSDVACEELLLEEFA